MDKVSVKQAAIELNQSQETIRSWMRHKVIDIGIADKKESAEHWHYIIYRKKLDAYKLEVGIGGNTND